MRVDPWAGLVLLTACAAAIPPASAASPPSAGQVASDVRTAARGFVGLDDHIGAKAVDALVGRLHAYPSPYLDEIDATYVSGTVPFDQHASLFLPDVLAELQPAAPRRTFHVAEALASAYGNAAVAIPRGPARQSLEDQARALEMIMRGIDVAPGAGWTPVTPDEICSGTAPGRVRRPALLVRRDCTCGEVLACRVSASGGTLRVETYADPTQHRCRACTRASTTCTLPAGVKPALQDIVASGGAKFGTLGSGCRRAGAP